MRSLPGHVIVVLGLCGRMLQFQWPDNIVDATTPLPLESHHASLGRPLGEKNQTRIPDSYITT